MTIIRRQTFPALSFPALPFRHPSTFSTPLLLCLPFALLSDPPQFYMSDIAPVCSSRSWEPPLYNLNPSHTQSATVLSWSSRGCSVSSGCYVCTCVFSPVMPHHCSSKDDTVCNLYATNSKTDSLEYVNNFDVRMHLKSTVFPRTTDSNVSHLRRSHTSSHGFCSQAVNVTFCWWSV